MHIHLHTLMAFLLYPPATLLWGENEENLSLTLTIKDNRDKNKVHVVNYLYKVNTLVDFILYFRSHFKVHVQLT